MLHGYPRERAVFVVAQRSAVQRWVAGHESLDALQVVGIDGVLELTELLERIHVGLELRPARKAIETGDLNCASVSDASPALSRSLA